VRTFFGKGSTSAAWCCLPRASTRLPQDMPWARKPVTSSTTGCPATRPANRGFRICRAPSRQKGRPPAAGRGSFEHPPVRAAPRCRRQSASDSRAEGLQSPVFSLASASRRRSAWRAAASSAVLPCASSASRSLGDKGDVVGLRGGAGGRRRLGVLGQHLDVGHCLLLRGPRCRVPALGRACWNVLPTRPRGCRGRS